MREIPGHTCNSRLCSNRRGSSPSLASVRPTLPNLELDLLLTRSESRKYGGGRRGLNSFRLLPHLCCFACSIQRIGPFCKPSHQWPDFFVGRFPAETEVSHVAFERFYRLQSLCIASWSMQLRH